ncbi:MAG: dihydropteroate synthase [candidate division Zixibacteria bacterium]|nr:dihydropteroate synthase [candidate division Zixibacteria bacterium]
MSGVEPVEVSASKTLKFRAKTYPLGKKTYLMAVLNVTPDSFFDGGRFFDFDAAYSRAQKVAEQGADFLDVGGLSTRPGSEPVEEAEELRRTVPLVEKLVKENYPIPISIDTYRSAVAEKALGAGAELVNDISGLQFDTQMPALVARCNCPVVIMHIKGTPRTMQQNPHYEDVVEEVYQYFQERLQSAQKAGIQPENVILDVGIGFGKRYEDNLKLLYYHSRFKELGFPLLLGVSRKSFIGKALADRPPEGRLSGSLAAAAWGALSGADIIRAHDTAETADLLKILAAIQYAQ